MNPRVAASSASRRAISAETVVWSINTAPARIDVTTVKNVEEERYTELVEKLEVDLSALEPDARDRLLAVVSRAIDASCTVGRTIKSGATVTLSVIDEATGETVAHSSEDGI